jgi:hypothetical protein
MKAAFFLGGHRKSGVTAVMVELSFAGSAAVREGKNPVGLPLPKLSSSPIARNKSTISSLFIVNVGYS